MKRVIISDDHTMLAMMFKIWFQQLAMPVEVLAMPTTGQATIKAVREMKPDVLLQDMMLSDMTGIAIIKILRAEFSEMMIVGMSAKPSLAKAALENGADGCMLKEDHPEALRDVMTWEKKNGKWISPLLEKKIYDAAQAIKKYKFTQSEENILRLAHLSNPEIASLLNLSEGTVRNAFTALYQKTEVKNRADLAQWAHNVLLLGYSSDEQAL